MKRALSLLLCPVLLAGWTACTAQRGPVLHDPRAVNKTLPEYKNPFAAHTYAHFVARKDYRNMFDAYTDHVLLDKPDKKSRKIVICLNEQRGQYLVDGLVAMDFPISSGVQAYPTPTGNYRVIEKKPDHSSNLYGKMLNAEGKSINSNAKATDPIPEGGQFVGSHMPYWQRLTWDGLGLHVGRVRRTPQSHGCVRLPQEVAVILYEQTSMGTPVSIQEEPMPVPKQQHAPFVKK